MRQPVGSRMEPLELVAVYYWLVAILSTIAASNQVAEPELVMAPAELKFQVELENVTLTRHVERQQAFKCQVRLAPNSMGKRQPVNGSSIGRVAQTSARPLSEAELDSFELARLANPAGGSASKRATVLNASLTIEWFRNGQPIDEITEPGVIVINRELGQAASKQSGASDKKRAHAGHRTPRIEIKNTLNEGQLKLSSRLKLVRLKFEDAASYRCVGRARFAGLASLSGSADERPSWFEQSLESAETQLLVVPSQQAIEHLQQQQQHDGNVHKLTATATEPPDASDTRERAGATNESEHAKSTSSGQFSSPIDRGTGRAGNGQQQQQQQQHWPVDNDNRSPVGDNDDAKSSRLWWASHSKLNEDDEDLARLQFGDQEEPASADEQPAPPPSLISGHHHHHQAQQQNEPHQQPDNAHTESQRRRHNGSITGRQSINVRARDRLRDNGLASERHHHNGQQASDTLSESTTAPDAHYEQPVSLAGATRHHLVRLLQQTLQQADQVSGCYTNMGENYRGNESIASDGTPCVPWSQVARHLAGSPTASSLAIATRYSHLPDHRHCRNPTMDPAGPWCYVKTSSEGPQVASSKYEARTCGLSPCSEFVWLYIVAPPVGLFTSMLCLAALVLRLNRRRRRQISMKRDPSTCLGPESVGPEQTSCASRRGQSRQGHSYLAALLRRLTGPLSLNGPKSNSQRPRKIIPNYIDDEHNDCTNDISHQADRAASFFAREFDWTHHHEASSDKNCQRAPPDMPSPKSLDSLRLDSSFSATSSTGDESTRQILAATDTSISKRLRLASSSQRQLKAIELPSRKANVHEGPMFATLRCHLRSPAANSRQARLSPPPAPRQTTSRGMNKSSTFVDTSQYDIPNWPSSGGSPLGATCASGNQQGNQQTLAIVSPSHKVKCQMKSSASSTSQQRLISCSTTSNDFEALVSDSDSPSRADCRLQLEASDSISGRQMARLEPSWLTLEASSLQQPLYEGKFAQVQLARLNQEERANNSTGARQHMGAQVALYSLKSGAPTSGFKADTLRLRNLNHLNLLKVIGLVQWDQNGAGGGGSICSGGACALVFDMSQLIDLSDWLREQDKSKLVLMEQANEGAFGVRRNLACLAKQLALAIDYLHDRKIIYRDLACRNCFLEPTKMLVKLASFNLEPVGEFVDEASTSMIRPKYLLDYYVIDSRPSNCQLLPLSWIPLESILFNKFNAQTDVWSFGCLVYELYSLGEVAYFGYSSKQIVDGVRANLRPRQPVLCPDGVYRLLCACLSDIPHERPTIKQIYEQLNLYTGQCSSFLDHHLCSLATVGPMDLKKSNGQSEAQ